MSFDDYFREINILHFPHLYQFRELDLPTSNPTPRVIGVLGLSEALFEVYFQDLFGLFRPIRMWSPVGGSKWGLVVRILAFLNISWYVINSSFKTNLIIFSFFWYASMSTKNMTINNCSQRHRIKYIIDFIPDTVSLLLSKTTFLSLK